MEVAANILCVATPRVLNAIQEITFPTADGESFRYFANTCRRVGRVTRVYKQANLLLLPTDSFLEIFVHFKIYNMFIISTLLVQLFGNLFVISLLFYFLKISLSFQNRAGYFDSI